MAIFRAYKTTETGLPADGNTANAHNVYFTNTGKVVTYNNAGNKVYYKNIHVVDFIIQSDEVIEIAFYPKTRKFFNYPKSKLIGWSIVTDVESDVEFDVLIGKTTSTFSSISDGDYIIVVSDDNKRGTPNSGWILDAADNDIFEVQIIDNSAATYICIQLIYEEILST
jgi:hypothetical protein